MEKKQSVCKIQQYFKVIKWLFDPQPQENKLGHTRILNMRTCVISACCLYYQVLSSSFKKNLDLYSDSCEVKVHSQIISHRYRDKPYITSKPFEFYNKLLLDMSCFPRHTQQRISIQGRSDKYKTNKNSPAEVIVMMTSNCLRT